MADARERFVTANRLRLHLLEWGDRGPYVLLLHGFLEHAHAWDWVAPTVAAAGFRVGALDWRGHGDSAPVGAGGYYHFIDYVADLADLVRTLGEAVILVGHSMGGGAAVLYAGVESRQVRALVLIEGLGVPDLDAAGTPDRVGVWLQDLRRAARRPRMTVSLDAAVERLRVRFPTLSVAAARHLMEHGTRVENGVRWWKFDPLHQTRAPLPLPDAQAQAFWQRVACPVLYVEGSDSWLRLSPADIDRRLGLLRARRVVIAGAGHHPHLEQPEMLARTLIEFSTEAVGRPPTAGPEPRC